MPDVTTQPRRPQTLVEDLRETVGSIRGQVYSDVGTRPMRVFLVRETWSGGRPGAGNRTTDRVELGCGRNRDGQVTPPKVAFASDFQRALQGVTEKGMATVTEILVADRKPATAIEADIVDFGLLDANQYSYVELVEDDRGGVGPNKPVRRFRITGAPERDSVAITWMIRLGAEEASRDFGEASS